MFIPHLFLFNFKTDIRFFSFLWAAVRRFFGFIQVSRLIGRVEESIPGRLLVFFPGEYRQNVYRFMDARDGFNYMAVPITSSESFLIA